MPQLEKLGRRGTRIQMTKAGLLVRYYDTPCMLISKKYVRLHNGGKRSYTTKTRMNQAANQFGLGLHVKSIRGKWYVEMGANLYPFWGNRTIKLPRVSSETEMLTGLLRA